MRTLDWSRPYGTVTPPDLRPDYDRPKAYEQDGYAYDSSGRQIVAGKTLADLRAAKARAPERGVSAAAMQRALVAAESDEATSTPAPRNPALDAAAKAVADLIADAETMAWPAFLKLAKIVLGAGCPAKKEDVLKALNLQLVVYQAGGAVVDAVPAGAPAAGTAPQLAGELDAGTVEIGPPNPVDDDDDATATGETPGFQGVSHAALAGETPPPPSGPKGPKAPPKAPAPAAKNGVGVDLAAWARGRQEYIFGEVRKEIDKRYARSVTERREAVEFLIDEGVIPAAEARKDV